ncbi:hypothetical protein GCM10007079_28490 [Nocardiopsis terrae]|nr:hypothetical protein GCM10007079_28490 [Nocardiopsis terrae]
MPAEAAPAPSPSRLAVKNRVRASLAAMRMVSLPDADDQERVGLPRGINCRARAGENAARAMFV